MSTEEKKAKQTVNCKFERIEKKFWMNKEQYQEMVHVFEKYMEIDKFGETQICNIYFDSDDYYLIRRSIERPNFKEKLRLRSYGEAQDDDKVFIEIKRKLDGIGYKRRVHLPLKEARTLLGGTPVNSDSPQIEGELLEFVKRYHPKPKVQLSYKRYAMAGKEDPELRITIDWDIRYKIVDSIAFKLEGSEPIMEDETMRLMEIKAIGAIPFWLINEMSRLKIYQAPFSKIGTCYTKFIAGKEK